MLFSLVRDTDAFQLGLLLLLPMLLLPLFDLSRRYGSQVQGSAYLDI